MKQGIRYYRDGVEIDEHEALSNGVLRDGVTLSVPTSMRDSFLQRARKRNIDRFNRSRAMVTDGFGNPAGNRPGYAFAAKDQAAQDARRAAYETYDADISRQWAGQREDVNSNFVEGASCTTGDGQDGHIRDGKCVPDYSFDSRSQDRRGATDAMTVNDAMADHRQRMERVYRESDARLSNAWRSEG